MQGQPPPKERRKLGPAQETKPAPTAASLSSANSTPSSAYAQEKMKANAVQGQQEESEFCTPDEKDTEDDALAAKYGLKPKASDAGGMFVEKVPSFSRPFLSLYLHGEFQ